MSFSLSLYLMYKVNSTHDMYAHHRIKKNEKNRNNVTLFELVRALSTRNNHGLADISNQYTCWKLTSGDKCRFEKSRIFLK